MIRDRFAFHAPGSADDAVQALADAGQDAVVLGGGTWVVPEMTRGRRRPRTVIDLRRAGLGEIDASNGSVRVGATATYEDVAASGAVPPLLRTLAAGITGGVQVRTQGTLGGSACYASPASDVPGALVALDATMHLRSAAGERAVPAAEFFTGPFTAAVRPGEILTAMSLPRPDAGERHGYVKFKLVQGSWPIVTAACVTGADGAVRALVVGGAAAVPVRVDVAPGTEDEGIERAAAEAVGEGWTDVLADGAYRRRIAGVIAKRAVRAAAAGTGEGAR